jgi:alpha-mannosidase
VLFWAHDVPSLGYRVYRLWSKERWGVFPTSTLSVAEARDVIMLQNEHLLVIVDRHTGHVASIFDKQSGQEVLSGPGNVLQAIAEVPGQSTAWLIALGDEIEELDAPESVQVVGDGPVQGTVQVRYRYRDSFFTQRITVTEGVPRVDLWLQVEWYERDCCLKVAFPTAIQEGTATFEAPMGAVARAADGAEVPAQRWIDVSDARSGVSLLNDCRYAFDIDGGCLRMTVVRGISDLDPEADVGHHDLRYTIYPHPGDWRKGGTVRQGWALNMPLIARQALPGQA